MVATTPMISMIPFNASCDSPPPPATSAASLPTTPMYTYMNVPGSIAIALVTTHVRKRMPVSPYR